MIYLHVILVFWIKLWTRTYFHPKNWSQHTKKIYNIHKKILKIMAKPSKKKTNKKPKLSSKTFP